MKKALFTFAIVLLSVAAQAQMKIQNDGQISLGTLSGSWNVGTQIYPSGCVHFNHPSTEDWKWVTIASPNAMKGKCWIVSYPSDKYDHRFFVTGDGYVYKRGSWRASDSTFNRRAARLPMLAPSSTASPASGIRLMTKRTAEAEAEAAG